ncbi:MAG: pyridoxal-phosphate dependent enzyme [Gemmatimonadota bacterium]|nr:pyridoxal-phosphate dependent enzyme [Gemmatimonadota bacterium]
MRLISTRGGGDGVPHPAGEAPSTWSFTEAFFLGQAPDGGLFVPASIPPLPEEDRTALAGLTFPERAFVVARHFLSGEVPDDVLRAVVLDALNFPVPLREIEPGVYMLELFHGPTHAFKDVGARFMARMMSALDAAAPSQRPAEPSQRPAGPAPAAAAPPVTILTATSGDTGGAVAHAFHGVSGVRVLVFFPIGKISPRQEAQITTLGGNIRAVAVRGTFDDCQRLVRQAFADPTLNARLSLTSANSVNIGRLLPQTFYYVHAWAELMGIDRSVRAAAAGSRGTATGSRSAAPGSRATAPGSTQTAHGPVPAIPDPELVVSVPSGNFGNLTAGLIARRALGMSRTRLVAATNANSVVPEYLDGHGFHTRPSVETISSAMDVGDPSNFRRIRHLFGAERDGSGLRGGQARPDGHAAPVPSAIHHVLSGSAWSDDETRACIRDLWRRRGIAIDPHTAVGLLGLRREMKRRPGARGVVLATAHPAKFAEILEPLIGEPLPVPPGIARVMDRPRHSVEIAPSLDAVRELLGEVYLAQKSKENMTFRKADITCFSPSTNATAT